jgi:hypothetical protein
MFGIRGLTGLGLIHVAFGVSALALGLTMLPDLFQCLSGDLALVGWISTRISCAGRMWAWLLRSWLKLGFVLLVSILGWP